MNIETQIIYLRDKVIQLFIWLSDYDVVTFS